MKNKENIPQHCRVVDRSAKQPAGFYTPPESRLWAVPLRREPNTRPRYNLRIPRGRIRGAPDRNPRTEITEITEACVRLAEDWRRGGSRKLGSCGDLPKLGRDSRRDWQRLREDLRRLAGGGCGEPLAKDADGSRMRTPEALMEGG